MMIANPHIFRAYDIRGHAEHDLNDTLVFHLAKALGTYYSSHGKQKIALSRDCRKSSPRIHQALLSGLLETGLHVVDIGVAPTPLMYFAVHHQKLDGGIQITGSHNPADQNGFKIMIGTEPLFGSAIEALRQIIAKEDFALEKKGQWIEAPITNAYLDFIEKDICIGNTEIRFAIDAGNGTAGEIACEAFKQVALAPVELLCNLDGDFPVHHPDPSNPKNLKLLIDTVMKQQLDFGIAWDGDGDRIGIVDRKGRIVDPDVLTLFFAQHLLKAKTPSPANSSKVVIGDVKCSQLLFDGITKLGGQPLIYKTGHSLIKQKIKETHAILAGEMSGHIFFAGDRFFGFDDGLYAALRFVEILSQDPNALDDFLTQLPSVFSTPEIRFAADDDAKHRIVSQFVEHHRNDPGAILMDGARIPMENGWGLVRASNTEPAIVIRLEASDASSLQKNQKTLENEIKVLKVSLT